MKKIIIFMVMGLMVLGMVNAVTTITDNLYSAGGNIDLNQFNITDFYEIRTAVVNMTLPAGDTIANELRYTSIGYVPNNTDLFTVRGDTLSTDQNDPSWWGYRNIVSRVNTYGRNDIAALYSVWHDYGASQGANTWMYIYEHPCNTTYWNCANYNASFNETTKYGLDIKFELLQNGTGKMGIRIDNNDPNGNSVEYAIRLLGNYSQGLFADNNANFQNGFINGNVHHNISQIGLRTITSLEVSTDYNSTTPVIFDFNKAIPAGSTAGIYVLNDAVKQDRYAALMWLRDARGDSTKPVLRVQNLGSGDAIYILNQGNSHGLEIDSNGTGVPLLVQGNQSVIACNAGNAGGIHYSDENLKHYGCNSTHWNALY